MENNSNIGIDIAKTIFEVCRQDGKGKTVERKRLSRGQVLGWMSKQVPSLVGIEACGGAHFWAREITKLGHEVRIIPPQYVKPYVMRNKSDRLDAQAIARALREPDIPCVSIASTENQDTQVLHRVRSRLIQERTALVNQLRGFLLEYGIALPKKITEARKGFQKIVAEPPESLSLEFRFIFEERWKELYEKEEKINIYTKKIEALVKKDPAGARVRKILGIGPLSASALLLKVRHESTYRNGRHFSASLGLVPRHEGTGGKVKLKGMSKRGDRYLRTLLIHGARAVIFHVTHKNDNFSLWIQGLIERRGKNKAAVAIANKNARIAWRLIAKEETYNPALAVNRTQQTA